MKTKGHWLIAVIALLCLLGWTSYGQREVAQTPQSTRKVVVPIGEKETEMVKASTTTECTFEVVEAPSTTISVASRTLLTSLGKGLLKQKEGSLVLIECRTYSGDSFPGWIDSDGNLVSILWGYNFDKVYPSGIPLLSYSGNSSRFRLLETKGGSWSQSTGTFKDVTVSLPPGSRASSAIYSTFSSDSISEYSARLLRFLGIAKSGNEPRVRLRLGDYTGTGVVDATGKLRIIDEYSWNPQ